MKNLHSLFISPLEASTQLSKKAFIVSIFLGHLDDKVQKPVRQPSIEGEGLCKQTQAQNCPLGNEDLHHCLAPRISNIFVFKA